MNPDVEELIQAREDAIGSESATLAADFSLRLRDVNGKVTSLDALRGKPIFLNFWATWCPPCIAEMPSINKLHKKLGNEVAFVIVSVDNEFETAKSFIDRKGYDFPIYTLAGKLPQMYQSSSIPTTFVIDSKGHLVMMHKGMADYGDEEFLEFLERL